MKLILYSISDREQEKKVILLCKQLQIITRKLSERDANVTVGKLVGGMKAVPAAGREKAPAEYRLPDCIVFSGIDSEALEEFLGAYKAAGIAPIGCKAVVTEYNSSWTLYELIKELKREQTAMLFRKV